MFCWPDTITLTTTPNAPDDSLFWTGLGVGFVPDTITTVDSTSIVSLVRVDSNGCQNSSGVAIIAQLPDTVQVIYPQMDFPDASTDTLYLCDGDILSVMVYDTISNPDADAEQLLNSETHWISQPSLGPAGTSNLASFAPDSSGIYIFTAQTIMYPPNEYTINSLVYTVMNTV